MKKTLSTQNILLSLGFIMLIDSMAYGIIFPVLPQLFHQENSGFILPTYFSMAILYGFSLAVYPLAQFLGVAFFGSMSDFYSRKRLLSLGLGLLIAAYFLAMLSVFKHNLWLFILARLMSGFFGGIYSISNAIISNLSGENEKERLINFRVPVLAGQIGSALGPALSAFFMEYSFFKNALVMPFFLMGILGTANFFLFLYSFKDWSDTSKKLENKPPLWLNFRGIFTNLSSFLKEKSTRLLACALFCYLFSCGLFIQGLSLHLTMTFDYTGPKIGCFIVVMNIVLIMSTYIMRYWARYGSSIYQLMMSLAGITLLFLTAHFVNEYNVFVIKKEIVRIWMIASFFYITYPISKLLFTTLFSVRVSSERQGSIMGAIGQIGALGYVTSGLSVGYVVEHGFLIAIALSTFSFSWFLILIDKLVNKK